MVEDLTGDENEGTVEGGAEWKPGRFGDAIQFASGKGECVTVPNSGSLQLPEEVTIEAWIRPEGTLVNDPIVAKEGGEEGPDYSYRLGLGVGPSGTLEGYAGEEEVRRSGVIEPDVRTHVAFTYDGARDRLYVDGEEVASEYVGSHTLASEGPLRIGCGGRMFFPLFSDFEDIRMNTDRGVGTCTDARLLPPEGPPLHRGGPPSELRTRWTRRGRRLVRQLPHQRRMGTH